MRVLLLLLLAAEPIGPKNWLHHPKIEEVRSIVAAVDAAALKKREVACESESRTLYVDDMGRSRRYTWFTGSGDSVQTIDYYYDEQERLRFAVCIAGAVPSAHSESRIWFGEDGKKLWSTYSFKGEGPGFNIDGSEDHLVRAPKKHFASKPAPCGEAK